MIIKIAPAIISKMVVLPSDWKGYCFHPNNFWIMETQMFRQSDCLIPNSIMLSPELIINYLEICPDLENIFIISSGFICEAYELIILSGVPPTDFNFRTVDLHKGNLELLDWK